jgi:hypothetical protein
LQIRAGTALAPQPGRLSPDHATTLFSLVSAVVVNRDGDTIVAMRADEASPHTMENARRTAYTARTFKQPAAEYAKKLQDPTSAAHQQVTLQNVIAMAASRSSPAIRSSAASACPARRASTTNASMPAWRR